MHSIAKGYTVCYNKLKAKAKECFTLKRKTLAAILLSCLMLSACTEGAVSDADSFDSSVASTTTTKTTTTATTTTTTTTTTAEPEVTTTTTGEEVQTEPVTEHSELYIEGVSVEEVIEYFGEVCLDAEFVYDGNPTVLQKWEEPIVYSISGDITDEDRQVLEGFTSWLNTVEGFPGISEGTGESVNMEITFCNEQQLLSIMGEHYINTDGAVEFWYMDDVIYTATICYRSDIDQYIRNSVIIEEIYNGLGPIQDTWLREDSIIYAGYSTPQQPTEVDELIIRLLYNEELQCGMDKEQCEDIIRGLYY